MLFTFETFAVSFVETCFEHHAVFIVGLPIREWGPVYSKVFESCFKESNSNNLELNKIIFVIFGSGVVPITISGWTSTAIFIVFVVYEIYFLSNVWCVACT